MESVAVTRDAGMTFATPVTITKGTLSAFARLASGTVLVGGVAHHGQRRHDRRRLSIDRRRQHLRALDAGAAATHSRPRRTWRRAVRRGQELQRRLGAGDVARRRRDDHAAVHATRTCAASSRARWRCCGDQCKLVASQAVWTNDVCTRRAAGRGHRRRRTPDPAATARRARRCRAARLAVWVLVGARARDSPSPASSLTATRALGNATAIRSTVEGVRCKFGFLLHTVLQTAHPYKAGPIAQRSELAAHNRLVPGSNPGGPTLDPSRTRAICEYVQRNATEEPELRDQLKRLEDLQRHDAKIQELESSLKAIPHEARGDGERPGPRRGTADHRAARRWARPSATTPSRRA